MNHERKLSCVRFPKTAAQRFPAQAGQLNAAFDARLRRRALLAEHARDSKEKQWHLKRQILPGIAAYETLQTVLPKDEALQTVHSYVEQLAKNAHHDFGPAAGFALTELQTGRGIWRIDMTKCPYHDTCVQHGCPELCPCFCDSDDISYAGLHPKFLCRRTTTLGLGGDRCDFCLKIQK